VHEVRHLVPGQLLTRVLVELHRVDRHTVTWHDQRDPDLAHRACGTPTTATSATPDLVERVVLGEHEHALVLALQEGPCGGHVLQALPTGAEGVVVDPGDRVGGGRSGDVEHLVLLGLLGQRDRDAGEPTSTVSVAAAPVSAPSSPLLVVSSSSDGAHADMARTATADSANRRSRMVSAAAGTVGGWRSSGSWC
jgi:hypothetical protein